ncbi:MAG TPA: alanine racemase [Bryobacteraceae bacterium]|nr:alanine racemase [Bryobacteraceae bacterium]
MYRSWLEVSLSQIAANFRAIRKAAGAGVTVMPVVKADAYRHGAVEVSRVLEEAGARWLAVSNVHEGIALRESGMQSRILVMADFLPANRALFLDYDLTPAIHSLEGILDYERLAAAAGKTALFHLKIDTGMGRLGTRASAGEILDVLAQTKAARLEGLMTHFASAPNYSTSQTDEQIATFTAVLQLLRNGGVTPALVHLSSTVPVAYGRKEAWGNLVRPGHAIYGYVSPAKGAPAACSLEVRPALSWKARVLEVKDIPPGAAIGYGAIHRTARPTRVAILGVGYADGYPHRLSNKGKVLVQGRSVPVLGAVSMDLTTVDVTGLTVEAGDAATLLGVEGSEWIDAQQIAKMAGTISYSVLCGISSRVVRLYV